MFGRRGPRFPVLAVAPFFALGGWVLIYAAILIVAVEYIGETEMTLTDKIAALLAAIGSVLVALDLFSPLFINDAITAVTAISAGVTGLISAWQKEQARKETEMALREMTALASVNHAE